MDPVNNSCLPGTGTPSSELLGHDSIPKKADFPEKTIAEWRRSTMSFGKDIGEAAKVSVIDRNIVARDGYSLACRIFNHELPSNSPVFVYYPGCAFLFDFFEVNSVIASRIAEKAGIKVVLVQFRLAPENSVLTSLHDSYDAARDIARHPEAYGINPHKFFIGGWCSGANAAVYVSQIARETGELTVHHQILLSGCFDLSHSFRKFDEYEEQDTTVNRGLIAHLAHVFYSMDSSKNPLFSPYWSEDVTNLPSSSLIFGEFDALRNDSEAYYLKLKAANATVDKIVLEGRFHNSIVMQDPSVSGPDPAEQIALIIRENLSSPEKY